MINTKRYFNCKCIGNVLKVSPVDAQGISHTTRSCGNIVKIMVAQVAVVVVHVDDLWEPDHPVVHEFIIPR